MNTLIENNRITEIKNELSFSLVLEDSDLFSQVAYKVLHSQPEGTFVKCMKTMFNGKVQILYLTDELKPFITMLPSFSPNTFLSVVSDLLKKLNNIKEIGFLSCQNVDISFDKVYIEPSTNKVSLVYIPTNEKCFESYLIFENSLRHELDKLISRYPNISSVEVRSFSNDLNDSTIPFDDLHKKIKSDKTESEPMRFEVKAKIEGLRLIATNTKASLELFVNKKYFVIGKKETSVDGVVRLSDRVSRVHCRIDMIDEEFYITDLESMNGTYVNGKRLIPNQKYPIRENDIISLADVDFKVVTVFGGEI